MLNRLMTYNPIIHFSDTAIDSIKPLIVTITAKELVPQVDHLLGNIALIISLLFTAYKFYVEYQIHKERTKEKTINKPKK